MFFSNVLVPGQRVYNKNKTKHYIDNHKTIKLADQFKSLHISILSQDALNKIEKPLCELMWPRNIKHKFQKVENMSKTKKSTSYSSFTKVTYNWIYFSTRLPVNFFKTSNQCQCVSKSTTKFMYKDCHLKAIKVTLKTINVPKFYSMVFPVYSSHQLICPLIYSLVTTMGFWYIVQCCWWIGNR